MSNRLYLLIFSVVLSAVLFAACADNSAAETVAITETVVASEPEKLYDDDALTLALSAGDTLDPFTATTQNNLIVTDMIYEPLIRLDDSFTAVGCLAVSYSQDDMSITAVLDNGVLFSDGAKVTAEDVVYSFMRAKESPGYASELTDISSASASEQGTVVFSLSRNIRYPEKLLVFPVMSATTGLGTGAYALSSDGTKLVPNVNYRGEPAPAEAGLLTVADNADMTAAYRSKAISFIYDQFDDGLIRRYSGTVTSVPLNRFIYLGFNSANRFLSDIRFRNAVCAFIDTAAVASDAYHGYAAASSVPFNPVTDPVKEKYPSDRFSDRQTATALLAELGFSQRGTDGILSDGTGELALTILVNNENTMRKSCAEKISAMLTAAGIGTTVTTLPYDQYMEALAAGSFDMYIGEVKLAGNMDLFPFFGDEGAAGYGINSDLAVRSAYYSFCEGTITIEQFISAFDAEKPFMPLCFRCAAASYQTPRGEDVLSTIWSR